MTEPTLRVGPRAGVPDGGSPDRRPGRAHRAGRPGQRRPAADADVTDGRTTSTCTGVRAHRSRPATRSARRAGRASRTRSADAVAARRAERRRHARRSRGPTRPRDDRVADRRRRPIPTSDAGAPSAAHCGGDESRRRVLLDVRRQAADRGATTSPSRPSTWIGGVCDKGIVRTPQRGRHGAGRHRRRVAVLVVCDGVTTAPDSDRASLAACPRRARRAADGRDRRTGRRRRRPSTHWSAHARRRPAPPPTREAVAVARALGDPPEPPSCTFVAAVADGRR